MYGVTVQGPAAGESAVGVDPNTHALLAYRDHQDKKNIEKWVTASQSLGDMQTPPRKGVESGHFVVGAELAVQSQQRRTTVHDTHSCSQLHCLVLEQTIGS